MNLARALLSLACLGALSGCGPAHIGDSRAASLGATGAAPASRDPSSVRPGPKRHRSKGGRISRHIVDYVSLPFVSAPAGARGTADSGDDVASIDLRTADERDDRLYVNAPGDLIGTLASGDTKVHTLERPPETTDSPCLLPGKIPARFRGIRRAGWTKDSLSYLDVSGRLTHPENAKPRCLFEPEQSRALEAKAVVRGLVYAGRGPDDRIRGRERLILVMPDTVWVAASPHVRGGGVTFDGTFTVVELPVERTSAASVVAQIPEASLATWNAWRSGDQHATPEPAYVPDGAMTTVVVDVTWGHAAPAPAVVIRVTSPAPRPAHPNGPTP